MDAVGRTGPFFCPDGDAPVYAELGELSVVLGANDTGKSRTLVALHEALRRFSRRRVDDDEPPPA